MTRLCITSQIVEEIRDEVEESIDGVDRSWGYPVTHIVYAGLHPVRGHGLMIDSEVREYATEA